MKFLLLIGTDEPLDVGPTETDVAPWVQEMTARGVRLMGNRLAEPGGARTVRVRGGKVFVTDGPFAETKEEIGGFDVIECADLDEAIEVASNHPLAKFGLIEVRPFWPEEY